MQPRVIFELVLEANLTSHSLLTTACQKWASYDVSDANDIVKTRVNHTMVLRPPGAAGASKTSYTAYIFGGFDGYEHNDVVNITINIYPPAAADVNRCRGNCYFRVACTFWFVSALSLSTPPLCLSIFKIFTPPQRPCLTFIFLFLPMHY